MSKTYNNRARSDRYQGNRSYIHRPGSVEWWRGACALAAIVVSAWFVWHFGFSPEARENGFHSSRGELAYKHSAWNERCDACHIPADQITDPEHKDFWSINGRWKEFSCRHCHAGPPHHTYLKAEDSLFDKNCAACHHDHSGKEYSLVRISDEHCTRCHSDLESHPNKNNVRTNYAKQITHFGTEAGHPEFSALTKEHKRTIKFSHTLHMAPGIFINQNPSKGEDVFSVAKVKEIEDLKYGPSKTERPFTYVDRYQQFQVGKEQSKMKDAEGNPIEYTQLTCMACHELDSGRRSRDVFDSSGKVVNNGWNGTDKIVPEAPKENLLPARAEGAYYLPVNFEKHCQGCHPIAIDLNTRDGHKLRLDLPHRKQLNDFSETLFDRVTRIFLIDEAGVKTNLPTRLDKPLVRKGAEAKKEGDAPLFPANPEGKEKLKEALGEAKKKLFDASKGKINDGIKNSTETGEMAIKTSGTTCQKCHVVDKSPNGDLFVAPGNTPSVWFEHSKFSHVGHRAMTCVECHKSYAATTPYLQQDDPARNKKKGQLDWVDPEEWNSPGRPETAPPKVDIVGLAECQKCHAPAKGEGSTRTGGVRHDCTDCHRYHNAEYPLQGMGAINRDPGFDPERGKLGTTPGLNPLEDERRDPTKRFKWDKLLEGTPPPLPK